MGDARRGAQPDYRGVEANGHRSPCERHGCKPQTNYPLDDAASTEVRTTKITSVLSIRINAHGYGTGPARHDQGLGPVRTDDHDVVTLCMFQHRHRHLETLLLTQCLQPF